MCSLGLQRKIRKAQDFVPVIESTEVLEDKDNEVTRVAHFRGPPDGGPGHSVKEVCKSYYPVKVGLKKRIVETGMLMMWRSTSGSPTALKYPILCPTVLVWVSMITT